jgi:hypothetical protein
LQEIIEARRQLGNRIRQQIMAFEAETEVEVRYVTVIREASTLDLVGIRQLRAVSVDVVFPRTTSEGEDISFIVNN